MAGEEELKGSEKEPGGEGDEENVEHESSEVPLTRVDLRLTPVKQLGGYDVVEMEESSPANLLGAVLE